MSARLFRLMCLEGALALVFALVPVFSVHAGTADLALSTSGISFSDDLVAGASVRVYAVVTNVGDEDVAGYVAFFQGSVPIGDSQVISVRAGGVPEEVYVDFVVPTGEFNIRAEIRGTDPEDNNPDNDAAITKLLTPVLDDDRDGVENDSDNCPSAKNSNQKNSDDDENGDACDSDDDNDGVTDEVEEEVGSDSTKADTDGDGVEDSKDAYPTDETRSVVPPPAPVATTKPTATSTTTSTTTPESTSTSTASTTETETVAEPEPVNVIDSEPVESSDLSFSPHSVFTYARLDWNRFSFAPIAPALEGQQYTWDFGDGVVSQRAAVEHTYQRPGSYVVTLKVSNPDGTSSSESVALSVPFFSLQNRVVVAVVAGLAVLALLGLWLAWHVGRSSRKQVVLEDAAVDEEVLEDEEEGELVPPLVSRPESPHKLTVRSLDSQEPDEE